MRLLPSEPTPAFVVSNIPERHATAVDGSDSSISGVLSLLRFMANRMACDPGRLLRPLTDVARHLCGADAAGICIERESQMVPASHLPVLIASGSCESLSGVDVPRAQSACAVAIADNRPKLFQVPNTWLPAASAVSGLAHGITAPWSAGQLRGTLWILNHTDADLFGVSKYRTLLVLADLVGSAFLNFAEQEQWNHEVFVSSSQALLDTLLEQVQVPLCDVQQQLEQAMRYSRGAGTDSLREASRGLQAVSQRIDSLLTVQTSPIQ